MKTIGTLRMKEIMIIEESNKEKDRAFQEKLAKIIIYYCSGCGKGYLPINEKLFLTAVVRGLARVVGIKSMKIITPYCLSRQYWRDDVEEVLQESVEMLMEVNDLPCNLYAVLVAIREILHVECDNDQTGGGDYRSPLMTIFKNIRDISEYCAKTFEVSQSVIGDVEKNIIPAVSFSNWSALYFVKTLSENTKWRHEILWF